MQEKGFLIFFICCAIFSQAILANFLEEDVGESSKPLIRQKRVIDRRPGHDRPLKNGDLPFVVNVRQNDRSHCVGSILSHHSVITAARCVESSYTGIYTIQSGSVYSFRGNQHIVTEKKMHGHNPSRASNFLTGIALLTVNPPFTFSTTTGSIGLHSAPVLAGMVGKVAGWANRVGTRPVESQYITRLRAIDVPIMNHRVCQSLYGGHFAIREEDICTYDPLKACGNTDAGAPLIIDNQLVGVHIGEIATINDLPVKPDVFLLLQDLSYRSWIVRNIVY